MTALVIIGGVLQVLGVLVLIAEVASVRAHEFNEQAPWTRALAWLRARLGPARTFNRSVRLEGTTSMTGSARVRPGPVPGHATHKERIARLERYVDALARDLDSVPRQIKDATDALRDSIHEREQERAKLDEQREEERLSALRWSLRRQKLAAFLVALGVGLATWGAL